MKKHFVKGYILIDENEEDGVNPLYVLHIIQEGKYSRLHFDLENFAGRFKNPKCKVVKATLRWEL